MMAGYPSKKRLILPLLALAGVALIQTSGQSQDTLGKARKETFLGPPAVPSDRPEGDPRFRRLSRQLQHFRTIGDLESAARVFGQLFPRGSDTDPVLALKTAGVPASNRARDDGNIKPVVVSEGSYPVFISPEREKNPSADVFCANGGDWTIVSAAEQWAGDGPAAIRIRKSSDYGLTWPETLVIGDGRALTQPSLRQVSDGTVGLAYVKEWDVTDGDIFFTRAAEDLTEATEFPVALSLSDQRDPSLTTDRQAYAAPYVYIVYTERDGPAVSVKFRVSPDLGGSWTRDITIDSFPWTDAAALGTAIAYDPDRNALHVAYTRPQGRSAGIAAATSTDFGATWSTPLALTRINGGADFAPRIAAKGGTVIVVHEHDNGASGKDIGLAYSTDSGRRWTTGTGLAATAARECSPDIRASVGSGTPRFFVSYVEENGWIRVLSSEGWAPGSWISETSFPEGPGSVPLGPAIVLSAPGPDGEESAGTLWTDTTADEDIYFSSKAILLAAGTLSVTPATGLTSTGPVGGPFSPSSQTYTLQNTGDASISWRATKLRTWTTLSKASGTLNAGASATVTVSINSGANSLAAGTYSDTVTFTNRTNGSGNTARAVSLTVTAAGVLSVTPATGLTSTGFVGGPFTPSSQTYTLQNTGGATLAWTAAKTQTWTTLSAASGTLDAGASATVTVSINSGADSLAAGTYSDTVTFTNTTNGSGDTTRAVSLTVSTSPVLSVSPGTRDVTSLAGTTTFDVTNTGGGTMDWTAAVAAGGDWLTITSGTSGTEDGTITAAFTANRTASSRVGIIRVTAAGASGSPRDVTVMQARASLSLTLGAERLIERAWIIQREYARLSVAVVSPTEIPVDKFVIYRKVEEDAFQVLAEVSGAAAGGAAWTYNDTFLETGTAYSYRVVALDALGNVISESNTAAI